MKKRISIAVASAVAAMTLAVGIAAAQWPTTCVELNDIVESHLGNDGNVGIYQKAFGDQAEQACRNDHREDVQQTFDWALPDAIGSTPTPATESAQPSGAASPRGVITFEGTGNELILERTLIKGGRYRVATQQDHCIIAELSYTGRLSVGILLASQCKSGTAMVVDIPEGEYRLNVYGVTMHSEWVITLYPDS